MVVREYGKIPMNPKSGLKLLITVHRKGGAKFVEVFDHVHSLHV